MNVLSCFDGVSCGQLALQRAGVPYNRYYASEVDKHAIKVTQTNFPNTIQVGDIKGVRVNKDVKIDLIIGGSPCQGFSFAGKQLNFDDERSKLFFEFVRLLEENKKINPDNYTSCISNSQRYKVLGNGWTVEVVAHIFKNLKNELDTTTV